MKRLVPLRVGISVSIIGFLVIAIAVFGALRGSDQYWYLTDTQTLIDGRPAFTHSVFPGPMLRGEFEDGTPFVHNGPLLYINAWAGQWLGALWAWKFTNLLWLCAAALATGALVHRYRPGNRWRFVAPVFLVASPLSVWLTANLLQEPFYAFLVAAVLYGALSIGYQRRLSLLIGPILFVGVLAHPLFVVLSVTVILDALWRRAAKTHLLVFLAALVLGHLLKDQWFPSSFPPSMLELVASSTPGGSNVLWHLMPVPPELSIELMMSKVSHAIVSQFQPLSNLPFAVVTLGGVLAWLWLAITGWSKHAHLLVFALLLYGAWAAMVVLTHPQVRYQMLIAPAAITMITLSLSDLMQQWRRALVFTVLALVLGSALLVDVFLLNRVRQDSRSDAQSVTRVLEQIGPLDDDDRVVLYGHSPIGRFLPMLPALAPRPSLFVEPAFLTQQQEKEVLKRFSPTVIISTTPTVNALPGRLPDSTLHKLGAFDDTYVFLLD